MIEALREAWGEIAREESVRDYFFKEVLEDMGRFQAAETAEPAPAAAPNPTAPTAPANPTALTGPAIAPAEPAPR